MTENSPELAAVEQLLAEGDALRGWLARLDQGPAGISDTVRKRVRDDYQHRLDQITAGLRAHADVVTSKLNDDRAEHADLLARATTAREALAEAELRHVVGEYDSDRFQGEQRRYSSDIETFELALGAAAERIARLEDVHALVERGPRQPIVDFEPEPVVDVPVDTQAPTVTINELAPEEEEALTVFDVPDVVEAPASSAGVQAPDNGPLSFRPSGVTEEWPRPVTPPPARAQPFASAPPLGMPTANLPPRFIRPGERLPPPATQPPRGGSSAEESIPEIAAVRTDAPTSPGSTADAAPVGRTLRCGECGAMNRPLEWYCEKCGAELTAV